MRIFSSIKDLSALICSISVSLAVYSLLVFIWDEIKKEIDTEKNLLVQKEKDYQAAKKTIEEGIKELETKLQNLEGQRSYIIPDVDKISLVRYEKILVNKEGLAIVPVRGTVCGGCNMNIPAQVVNEIKMHDKLILCELCARILYLEEDLETI